MKLRIPGKILSWSTYVILFIAVIGAISKAGNPDRPTLLLLHGLPTSSTARLQVPLWRPTSVAIIAAAGMRPLF